MNEFVRHNSGSGTASGCGNMFSTGNGDGLGIKKLREFSGLASDYSVFYYCVTDHYAGGSAPAGGFIGCDGKSASMGEYWGSFDGHDH